MSNIIALLLATSTVDPAASLLSAATVQTARQTARPAPAVAPMPALPGSVFDALAISAPASAQVIVGRWTDDGNCANIITFSADGTFRLPSGGGTWRLAGERLTFTGAISRSVIIRAMGRNRMILIHPDNSIGQSIRC